MAVIDKVREDQRERSQNLLHPFLSIKNHRYQSRPHVKNKYVRLTEMRQRFKMDRLGEKREKRDEQQQTQDVQRELECRAQKLEVTLEQLLEEEREEKANLAQHDEMERYQQELEDYFQDLGLSD